MHFSAPVPPARGDEAMLPLINVVFLLLVFFLLAGHMASVEPLAVEPPASKTAGRGDEQGPLAILLAADGRTALNDRIVGQTELIEQVREALAANRQRAIEFKADAGAPATAVIDRLDWLRQAGADRVELITRAGGD